MPITMRRTALPMVTIDPRAWSLPELARLRHWALATQRLGKVCWRGALALVTLPALTQVIYALTLLVRCAISILPTIWIAKKHGDSTLIFSLPSPPPKKLWKTLSLIWIA